MGKKPLGFGEMLQKKVDQINRKTQRNFAMYAEACAVQGKKVGEPIDIMSLLGKRKE
jgi:hypothetical protein